MARCFSLGFALTKDSLGNLFAEACQAAGVQRADLKSGRFSSIEELAVTAKLHPKVVRQALRLAFLAPSSSRHSLMALSHQR
jgi:hypothetical protein